MISLKERKQNATLTNKLDFKCYARFLLNSKEEMVFNNISTNQLLLTKLRLIDILLS